MCLSTPLYRVYGEVLTPFTAELRMNVATNFETKSSSEQPTRSRGVSSRSNASNQEADACCGRAPDPLPTPYEQFDLLPWADPYIAMLVNRYVAETKPARSRKTIRSVEVVVPERECESMLDRFAV